MREAGAALAPPPRGESLRAACNRLAARLAAAGVATAGLDARLLVQLAAGITHEEFVAAPGRALVPAAAVLLDRLLVRRLAGEPVARLAGAREFWGLEFILSEQTLVPRPESELLVETGLAHLRGRPAPAIADLGTGSGCLLVSLLAERPDARGIGIDLAPGALATAAGNARRHGVGERAQFVRGDWLAPLAPASLDLIVANPPYIPSREIGTLAAEVARFDPPLALDGGADGLDAVRRIAAAAAAALGAGGMLAIEIGEGQAAAAAALVAAGGLALDRRRDVLRDLAGIERVVRAYRPADT